MFDTIIVTAGVVEQGSSLGVKSDLKTPHPEYLALARTQNERLSNYRELFKAHIEAELLT